ncbi:MAG: PspC domain-containing protein [Pseudomonadales bacterium]|jgi:phage shock protein C|nr:PspC domain-containing protein [Pseudomonadales bacterium]MDP6471737.1 PspC domain-containing protein [Pseudomonadales bacterium]MDP6971431.1 PspC domain-containing protein [Pseudomonadales bacterium]|tara:strand:+ start:860 stop:1609 length:750 start_codon:yes stop_codon:yes gene_type:complete
MSDFDESRPGVGKRSKEFQTAVERLEKAVQELAVTAKEELTGRATTLIEETTSRLERELGDRKSGTRASADAANGPSAQRERLRPNRQRHRRHSYDPVPARQLYRDPENEKICGVCAGFANYLGVEAWVVRCAAITGLLFLPSIVFPAYFIAYFVMDEPPETQTRSWRKKRRKERKSVKDNKYSSPAPELGPRLSPRGSLRNVQADLRETELKLRRIETHITSGHYELQKELNKIDDGGRGTPACSQLS